MAKDEKATLGQLLLVLESIFITLGRRCGRYNDGKVVQINCTPSNCVDRVSLVIDFEEMSFFYQVLEDHSICEPEFIPIEEEIYKVEKTGLSCRELARKLYLYLKWDLSDEYAFPENSWNRLREIARGL